MFHVPYYLCLNVKFCGRCYCFAIPGNQEEMHNENLRSQGSSGNTFRAVTYSSNRMIGAIIDSAKERNGPKIGWGGDGVRFTDVVLSKLTVEDI